MNENAGNLLTGPYSGRTLSALLGAGKVEVCQASLESHKTDNAIVQQAASTIPPGLAGYLPEGPATLRAAQSSPEWPKSQGSVEDEMDGQISRGVWKTVDRTKTKTVLDTGLFLKRKIGKDGHVEKYKCRYVAEGLPQVKGLGYQASSSPMPTQPSIRMALPLMAMADWEERQLDVEIV